MSKVSANNRGNPFLSQVMRASRKLRPMTEAIRVSESYRESLVDGDSVQLWFPTDGCTWDGCTMCDYGKAMGTSADSMVEAVRRGMRALDFHNLKYLQILPSGSIFDEREVPLQAQLQIFDIMRESKVPVLFFETRAETVTHEALSRLREHIGSEQEIGIMIGLESSSAAVQRYCVNKGSSPQIFEKAAEIAHSHQMTVIANISLGTAFLSPTEAMDDAHQSLLWALSHGADNATLFTMMVKPHTLLHLLHKSERYSAPSLWAMVEVLRRVGPELISKVGISWYRRSFNVPIVQSPTSCELCETDVLSHLDEFFARRSWDVVEELSQWPCSCRSKWEQSLQKPTTLLSERVVETYDYLAEELSLQRFWKKRRDDFVPELKRAMSPREEKETEAMSNGPG
ncbi:hypothetical protein KAI87_05245 [Myxococcota bacterium]|nr:hypothetical protein [Myxococcota bacterium]